MKYRFSLIILLLLFSCSELIPNYEQELKSNSITANYSGLLPYNNRPVWDTLANGIILKKVDSLYYFQDDMVFKDRDLSFLCPSRSDGIMQSSYYWPGGIVYYSYHHSLLPSDTLKCRLAMNDIMANASVTFKPKTSITPNYVVFVPSSNTQSYVGMIGGAQQIEIDTSWVIKGNIIHEILHSLGFLHEHCRSDRDDYIVVYPENILSEDYHNFQKYQMPFAADIGNFDFSSIMMYSSMAFSSNGLPTMRKIDGTTFGSQRESLSDGDKAGIAAIYGPPFHRLESRYSILDEVVGGSTDKLITSNTDSLVFYSDKACTMRAALQYPREIKIKSTHKTANGGRYYESISYSTVIIPAGTISFFLGQWVDTEWYEYSNPYIIDITTHDIVNYAAPHIFWSRD